MHTIGELRQLSADVLSRHFGKHGDHLWRLAHGLDKRRVVPDRNAKSISHETTFETDICELETLRAWLLHLTEQVAYRLRRHQLKGPTVQIKVRYGDFHTITRATTLPEPTNTTRDIWEAASRLLTERLPKRRLQIRLLGVGVTGFAAEQSRQMTLFDETDRESQSRLDEAVDDVRDQFGRGHLLRGSDLELRD